MYPLLEMLSSYWNHIIAIIIMCYAAEPFTFVFAHEMVFAIFRSSCFGLFLVRFVVYFFFLEHFTLPFCTFSFFILMFTFQVNKLIVHRICLTGWMEKQNKSLVSFNLIGLLHMLFICSRINLGLSLKINLMGPLDFEALRSWNSFWEIGPCFQWIIHDKPDHFSTVFCLSRLDFRIIYMH